MLGHRQSDNGLIFRDIDPRFTDKEFGGWRNSAVLASAVAVLQLFVGSRGIAVGLYPVAVVEHRATDSNAQQEIVH